MQSISVTFEMRRQKSTQTERNLFFVYFFILYEFNVDILDFNYKNYFFKVYFNDHLSRLKAGLFWTKHRHHHPEGSLVYPPEYQSSLEWDFFLGETRHQCHS